MQFKNLFLAILLLYGLQSFAGSVIGVEADPFEKIFITNIQRLPDQQYQQQLQQMPAWQHFLADHNKWVVTFNEENQKPHRAFGEPITVTPGADARATALNFIQNSLNEFNIPVNELEFQTTSASKYQNVIFKQHHKGLEVLFSRMSVKMTLDNRVVSWTADVYDNIAISTTPAINEAGAISFGSQNIPAVTSVSTPVLRILPVPAFRSNDFRLVYEMYVEADIPDSPARYYTLVDANTGEVLYRQNKVLFITPLNTDVNVTGTLYKTGPTSPSSVQPLKNMEVVVGSTTYYTDSLGNAAIPGNTSQSATFSLEGYWSKVVTGSSGTTPPSFSQTLNVGSNVASFDAAASIRHLSGYYHVNIVHDFMKKYFPAFTSMDSPLLTKIDVSGSCNAFYNGTSINFYATGGGCVSMAQIGDVVYHEYGHGINDQFYSFMGGSWDNGSMGEGYADVWGFSITQLPKVGAGYTGSSTSYIRTYDFLAGARRKVYPADLTGEVHANGEIIAGAWYDTKLKMNSWSGMTSLFAATYFDLITAPGGSEGQLFSDILLSALQQDDNDGNLNNGTPNAKSIIDAFALHGITLSNALDLQHTEVLSAPPAASIPVTTDVINALPFLGPNYVNLCYRTTTTGTYTKIPMSLVSGTTYSANIPPQVAGTLIRYYIELLDSNHVALKTDPAEASATKPNIPYFILVDYSSVFLENFEGNTSSWLLAITGDNATTGKWVITAPVASYDGNTICQPGTQHTPSGTKCAVTGNATSGSGIGTNDVDGGKTTLQSPTYSLTGYAKPAVAFWRWYTNDQGSNPRTNYWKVYASANGTTFSAVENIDVPDHSYRRYVFRVADLLPGATQITLRFVAEDATQSLVEAAVDDVELFDLQTSTGISALSNPVALSVYPNPANDQLIITIPQLKGKAALRITNSIGAVVYEEQIGSSAGAFSKHISIKNFAAGIYHVSLQSEEATSHVNVMVQH